jgi:hypothetical protein
MNIVLMTHDYDRVIFIIIALICRNYMAPLTAAPGY